MSSWGCTKMEGLSSLLLLLTIIVQCLVETHAVAVMSVDFGNEWMKVAIVSPGVPMEIALNKESKRKTPIAIAFRDNERTFGEDAISVGVRFPKQCYMYLLDLLGKKVDNPVVKMYQERFPYYDIVADPERGTVLFQHDSETQFSVEELVGMMLKKAQDMAIASAGQAVNEAVITVPGYFNQAERKAMLHAAELAGIKVLQLINDYTAVALNYGIFRRKDFNETAQYIMFYDMGASSTTATLVSYQMTKVKEKGIAETHPQLTVLGVGYDRNLGGLEKQLRLRDYLGKKFNEMKKTPNDVLKNPRSMAKLFKEAGRLKNVLSANADHFAQVEGLLDEIDFKLQITRDQFEKMCSDLFERVKMPALNALKSSGLTLDVINQVILAGAGTRVPAVQDRLTALVGSDLGKNLNTDEAAVLGAVYKAADLSAGFKVKKFITKDAVLFPIQVTFEREAESGTKLIKRTLFGPMNPYPQKRILTFNKHTNDFDFHVGYGELDFLDQFHLESLGSFNLSKITLSGVADAISKHQGPKSEIKGVKAHFLMDESGILAMTSAELVVEKTVTEDELKVADESPLSKLGSTISNFFTGVYDDFAGDSDRPDESKHETVQEEKPSADDSKEEGMDKKEESGGTEGSDDTGNRTSEQEGGTGTGSGEEKEEEKKREEEGGAKEGEEGIKKQPKVVTIKEPIASREESFVLSAMKEATLDQSKHKLNELNSVDEERRKRESVLNALESFVFETKMRLETEEYGGSVAPDEKAKISEAVDRVSVWLDEDSYGSSAEELTSKLKDLQNLTDLWYRRVHEQRERPEALSALFSMINGSRNFLSTIKNMSIAQADSPQGFMFTTVEIETLEKAIVETEDWKDKHVTEQQKLALYENPKLTVKMMMDKMASLDREVQYLVNKAKIWKPKQPEEPLKEPIIVPGTNETDEKTNRTEEVESKDAEAKEPEQPPQVEEGKESKKESKAPKEERKEEPKTKDVKVEEIPTVEDAKKETPSLPETKDLPTEGTGPDEHVEL